jgi:preprotein translocase subunit SecA
MLGGNLEMLLEEASEKITEPQKLLELTDQIKKQIAYDKQMVINAGGLFVLATERHESRRIDNQLRGRAGRQGDKGASKFFLSLEDDLMRIFGSERISGMLQKLGLKDGESITHPWISRAIEKAQQKVEGHNFEIRRNLLKFDDVMNNQRKVIYEQRIELMDTEDVSETIKSMRDEVIEDLVSTHIPPKSYPEQWDMEGMHKELSRTYNINLPVQEWAKEEGVDGDSILNRIDTAIDEVLAKKEESYGSEIMRMIEKRMLLLTLDQLWKDHLLSLDHLRQGIGLRAYGQKDPLNEYKREAFTMFEEMLLKLREVVTSRIAHLELSVEQRDVKTLAETPKPTKKMKESRLDPAFAREAGVAVLATAPKRNTAPEDRDAADPATWGKVARNEPCPCGSGKKYKQCHGMLEG